MFYKKSNSANEIERSLFEKLSLKEEEVGIQDALQSLANSADLFESLNLPDEAEVITQFIETIASGQFALVKEAKKKSKKKTKSKTKTKKRTNKTNEFSKDLTPEKELSNLLEVGWVFNAPGPVVADGGSCNNCGSCMDCSMADDTSNCDKPADEYKADFDLDSHFPRN